MIISSTNGSLTPFLAHMCNLDPAKFAGPLETAFQVNVDIDIGPYLDCPYNILNLSILKQHCLYKRRPECSNL